MAMLDVMMVIGVLAFGTLMSMRMHSQYKISHVDFLATTAYVAALSALIVAVYHALRSLFAF